MKIHIIFVLLLFLAFQSQAAGGISAVRQPGESYQQARHRAMAHTLRSPSPLRTPEQMSGPLDQVDPSQVAEWTATSSFQQAFEDIRDTRFLKWDQRPDFPRRPSWLYPDDGCYARAELGVRQQEKQAWPLANKIFVFGNLSVTTPNSPYGHVSWWYHVAPLYRHQNQLWVWDPALEPAHPLPVAEWVALMSSHPTGVRVAICQPHTYDPDDSCIKPNSLSDSDLLSRQSQFLSYEWSRLLRLNRIPENELGEQPPWKK